MDPSRTTEQKHACTTARDRARRQLLPWAVAETYATWYATVGRNQIPDLNETDWDAVSVDRPPEDRNTFGKRSGQLPVGNQSRRPRPPRRGGAVASPLATRRSDGPGSHDYDHARRTTTLYLDNPAGDARGYRTGDPLPVDIGDARLRTGMGAFPADVDPHRPRPRRRVKQDEQIAGVGESRTHAFAGVTSNTPHRSPGNSLANQANRIRSANRGVSRPCHLPPRPSKPTASTPIPMSPASVAGPTRPAQKPHDDHETQHSHHHDRELPRPHRARSQT